MELRNRTTFDRKLILEYNRQHTHYFLKNFLLPFAIFDLGISIYFLIENAWQSAVLFLGVLVVYVAISILLPYVTTLMRLKDGTITSNPIVFLYQFNELGISIKNKDKIRSIPYDKVSKVVRLRTFLSIVDLAKNTYVVDLTSFEDPADRLQLQSLLASKLGKKYK